MDIGIGAQIVGASSWREDVPQNLLGLTAFSNRVTKLENKVVIITSTCAVIASAINVCEKPD